MPIAAVDVCVLSQNVRRINRNHTSITCWCSIE